LVVGWGGCWWWGGVWVWLGGGGGVGFWCGGGGGCVGVLLPSCFPPIFSLPFRRSLPVATVCTTPRVFALDFQTLDAPPTRLSSPTRSLYGPLSPRMFFDEEGISSPFRCSPSLSSVALVAGIFRVRLGSFKAPGSLSALPKHVIDIGETPAPFALLPPTQVVCGLALP